MEILFKSKEISGLVYKCPTTPYIFTVAIQVDDYVIVTIDLTSLMSDDNRLVFKYIELNIESGSIIEITNDAMIMLAYVYDSNISNSLGTILSNTLYKHSMSDEEYLACHKPKVNI